MTWVALVANLLLLGALKLARTVLTSGVMSFKKITLSQASLLHVACRMWRRNSMGFLSPNAPGLVRAMSCA